MTRPTAKRSLRPSTASPQLASWVYDNANSVAGVTNPVGQLTTETSFSGGNAYTVQQKGFNVFGQSLGETITLPDRRTVAELRDYLFEHLYEHRAALDAARFRYLLDEYARYTMMAEAGVEEYPVVIVEKD